VKDLAYACGVSAGCVSYAGFSRGIRNATLRELSHQRPARLIELDPTLEEAQVTVAMTRLDAIWDQLFPAEAATDRGLLVETVIISPSDSEVRLRSTGIKELALKLSPALPECHMSLTRICKAGVPRAVRQVRYDPPPKLTLFDLEVDPAALCEEQRIQFDAIMRQSCIEFYRRLGGLRPRADILADRFHKFCGQSRPARRT
jgi:hypothetical protein